MDPTVRLDAEAELEKALGRTPKPPEDERAGRLRRIREGLEAEGLDGLLVYGSAGTNGEPVRFLSGYVNVFPEAAAALIVPRDGEPVLLIDQAWHLEEARRMSWIGDVRGMPGVNAPVDGLVDALAGTLADALRSAGLSSGRLGIFGGATPVAFADALARAMPELERAPGERVWAELVAAPSAYDLEMIRRTAAIADAGFAAAREAAGAGVAEHEVCMAALDEMASLGAEFLHGSGTSTHINIGSFSEVISNVRPFLYTTAKLEPGQMFWLDLSAAHGGYFIDADRTYSVGEPTAEQRRLHDVTLEMYELMRDMMHTGVTGHDVWQAAVDHATAAGFGESWNLVYLGHTTGISTSVRPVIDRGEDRELRRGSVVNIEPGIYVPGVGSACIENAMLIGADGAEALNGHPIGIQVV